MNLRKIAFVSVLAVQGGAACKNGSETSTTSTPPSAGGPAIPAGFDHLVVAPSSAKSVEVPGAEIQLGNPSVLDEERAGLAKEGATRVAQGVDRGEVWRNDATKFVVIYRTLEKSGVRCKLHDGPDAARGEASCKAMVIRAEKLYVPMVIPEEQPVVIAIDDVRVTLARADSDMDASSVDEQTANARAGLEIFTQKPQPGGFAVSYRTFNGGVESQGYLYKAVVRAKRGALDLVCKDFGASSTEEANRALATCVQLVGS